MLTCRPLNGSFGVEVLGATLDTPEDDTQAREVVQALYGPQFQGESRAPAGLRRLVHRATARYAGRAR
ncbi:hypothetical protein GCM10023086_33400 [Streptomyces venetus]|uniref:Uncharacterized protein n=1 Tax=Streptomyces venetus TaxID=1701086 RepID=A0ABP8FXL8_9ACTN